MDDKPRRSSSGSAREYGDRPPPEYRMRSSSQDADEGIEEMTEQFEQFGINERPPGLFSSMEKSVSTRHTNDGSVTKTVSTYLRSETTTGTTIDWQNRPKVHKSVNDDWAKMQGYVWLISPYSKLYAQLRRDMIFFYKGEREQQSDLSPSVQTFKLPEHHCRRFERFDFGWKNGDETYMLRCVYQDELEKWVRAINHNIQRRNNPTSHIHGDLTRVESALSVKEKADSSWEMVEKQKTQSSEKETTYEAKPASIESNDFNNQQYSSSTSSRFHKLNNHGTCYEESSGVQNTTVETKLSDTLDLVPDQKQVKLDKRSAVAKFNFEEETPIFSSKEYQRKADVHLSHAEQPNLHREGFQKRTKSEHSEDSHYMEASNIEGQVHLEGLNSKGEYKQMNCYGILRGQILNFYHVGEHMSRSPIYSIKLKSGYCVSCPSEAERQTWFRLLHQDSELRFLFKSQAEKSKWMNEIAHAISRLDKDEPRRSDSPQGSLAVPPVEPSKDSSSESEISKILPVELDSRQSTTTLPENATPTPCASSEISRTVYDIMQSHGYNYQPKEHEDNRFKTNPSELVQETASNFSRHSTDSAEEVALKDVSKSETSTDQEMNGKDHMTNRPVLLEGQVYITKLPLSGSMTEFEYFVTLRENILQFFINQSFRLCNPIFEEELGVGCFVENVLCEADSDYHAFRLISPYSLYEMKTITFRLSTEQEKTEWIQAIRNTIQDAEKKENQQMNTIASDKDMEKDCESPVVLSKSLTENLIPVMESNSGLPSPMSPGAKRAKEEREKDELQITKAKVLRWVQELTDKYKGVDVQNFDESWKDGKALIALVHDLSKGLVPFKPRKDVSDDDLVEALGVATDLYHFEDDTINIKHFRSGRGRHIFNFLNCLFDNVQSTINNPETQPAPQKLSETPLDATSNREEREKMDLLNWCRKKTTEVANLEVNNFTTSWTDGRVLSAILLSMRPEFIDPDAVIQKGDYESINAAIDIFNQLFGVQTTVEVEDVIRGNEDRIRYLAQCLRQYHQNLFGEETSGKISEQTKNEVQECPIGFERCNMCQNVAAIPESRTQVFKCMDCKAMYCRNCELDWYYHFEYSSCEEARAMLEESA